MNTTATDTLFLAKIGGREVFGWGSSHTSTDIREAAGVALDRLTDAGLIEPEDRPDGQHRMTRLTDAGRTRAKSVTPTDLCGKQTDGPGRAKAAMWLWLVLNGFETGSWGDRFHWGDQGQIAHILLCGLDLSSCGPVVDDSWTSVCDSYDSGTTVVGTSGRAACRCGRVADYTVYAETGSMIEMLTSLLCFIA